jgi:hypothetical protein
MDQVDRDGGDDVRTVGLGQDKVVAAAQAGGGGGLVDGALDTSPDRIPLFLLLGGLSGPGLLNSLVELAGAQHQRSAGAGGTGALGTDRTGLTGRDGKAHDDRFSAAFGAG